MTTDDKQCEQGAVLSVKGSVVDASFPAKLPAFYSELRAGDQLDAVVEVVAHLDAETVRGIALTPTAGLAQARESSTRAIRSVFPWASVCWAGC